MKTRSCLPLLLSLAFPSLLLAQQDFDKVEIKAHQITESLYMLEGSGGNIGLSIGEDGALMIDDQFAPLTEKILKAVGELTDEPVRFVINTHWHGDHSGGNENMAKEGAIIVAHTNVRERMSKGQFMKAFNRHVDPAPPEALPVVTFPDSLTLHWNEDELQITHHASAHTDGDAVIYFKDANVLHTGDLFFNGFYPFVDASSGGSLDGLLEGIASLLELANDETTIIPGHGPLAKKTDLVAYSEMLSGVRGKIQTLIDEGKTKKEIIEAKPTAEYDERWGGGFLSPNVWVGVIYEAMKPAE